MRHLTLAICFGVPFHEVPALSRAAGFDGFFSDPEFGNNLEVMTAQAKLCQEVGLVYDNSHSTIPGSELIWTDLPGAEQALDNFRLCIDNCAALKLPMTIIHVTPTKLDMDFNRGIKRWETLVDYAAKKNVQIAFENTGGADLLMRTIRHFDGCDTVGFCYDTGHEAFCTPGVRLLPQLGDRLIYTHFSDNYLDGDHHLLPFDGKMDYDRILGELRDTGYQGKIALEVSYTAYKDQMTPQEYVKKAYGIGCRIAEALDG